MQPLPLSHPGLPGELVLLAAERTVTVTREEHHQDVLAGRTGPTIAELRPCTITAGKHAGPNGLEVVLDGRRVGELTRLMAQPSLVRRRLRRPSAPDRLVRISLRLGRSLSYSVQSEKDVISALNRTGILPVGRSRAFATFKNALSLGRNSGS